MTDLIGSPPRSESDREIAMLRSVVRDSTSLDDSGWPDSNWPAAWTDAWTSLADLGLWATLGQSDGSLTLASAVTEELGANLFAGPVVETLVSSYLLAQSDRVGTADDVMNGSALATFTTGSLEVTAGPEARATGSTGQFVDPHGESVVVIASGEDLVLAHLSANASVASPNPLDLSRSIGRLRLHDHAVEVIAGPDSLATRADAALGLLYCSDTIGCVSRIVHQAVDYAGERTTFGAKIGVNQAVAHRLVDHVVTLRQMRLLLDDALGEFDRGGPDLQPKVAAAEVFYTDTATNLVSDCIQLSGAIGFTWEVGIHFFLRRVQQNSAVHSRGAGARHRLAQASKW